MRWRVVAMGMVLLQAGGRAVAAQQPVATVREVKRTMTTYPYGDPDPVPRVGRIYPYFRFDGFTTTPVSREWTVVELENPWLKVAIYPEIGGKIWNIIDKATGRSIVYDNHVVKFRDVAMRGPWTSGGIEANYGIIGHTPTVASPIDYVTRTNADGSVSCIIGALDLLTRTPWRLEITLPADKAYLTTSSFWYNASPLEQPYYTWMNAAAPVGNDLEYIYPGNRALGHDGEVAEWPVNQEQGKRVAWYRQNDFGRYKSYHVFGTYSDFVGVYYHEADAGTVRYAPHDEKPGKKLWIWGLSRQGMIWEQLLTDADGQYTEIQSGRLFNQTSDGSTRTPFKHRGFAPHASERWTEYWFPVRGIGGMVAASPWGALNVRQVAAGTIIAFSAAQAVRDTLVVRLGDRVLRRRALVLQPMQQFVDTLPGAVPANALRITLGDSKLAYDADSSSAVLDRPVAAPPSFDWTTAYGHYLLGKEHLRARDIMAAGPEFEAALARDQNYLPALSELASLALRAGRAAEAAAFARRALAIDSYDGQANYLYGLAHWRLGHLADAKDGLDLASQSVEYRAAAWSELARLYLSQADFRRAREYAAKALDYDRYGMDALQVRAVAARLAGDSAGAATDLATIAAIDPLSVVPSAERMLRGGDSASAREAVASRLRGEMPNETLLELAIWYHTAGQDRDADRILAAAAGNAELWYWRAWLRSRLGEADAERWIARAQAAPVRLGFPFRPETAEVLQWARARLPAWQTDYYLALTEWARGDLAAARRLLEGRGVEPEFAPFFGARAQLRLPTDSAGALRDWRHAMSLDPSDWRAGRAVVEQLLAADSVMVALPLAAQLARQFPGNPALGTLYPKVLLRAGRLREAVAWMDRLVVLPAEGSADARNLFREANLLLAVDRLAAGNASGARALVAKAREWPERLGAGKPYPADVDERLEDWLAGLARRPVGRVPAATAAEPPPLGADPVAVRVIRAWEGRRR